MIILLQDVGLCVRMWVILKPDGENAKGERAVMESIYCGGRFDFDYLDKDYREKAAADWRAVLPGGVDRLLQNAGRLRLSDQLTYVGPFYFESDGMIDRDIVGAEMRQVESCTCVVFLLDGVNCPGTVAEMVYAASLQKKIRVFYVKDENETESSLRSACWYPIILCQKICADTEAVACRDAADA